MKLIKENNITLGASTHNLHTGFRRALACQKWEQSWGELRNQGFNEAERNVKALDFQEARGNYFWLDFLLTFSSKEKVRRENFGFTLTYWCIK